jgi:hypothetical protein
MEMKHKEKDHEEDSAALDTISNNSLIINIKLVDVCVCIGIRIHPVLLVHSK